METDALVAVLQEQFPLYNQDSLTDVLKVTSTLMQDKVTHIMLSNMTRVCSLSRKHMALSCCKLCTCFACKSANSVADSTIGTLCTATV